MVVEEGDGEPDRRLGSLFEKPLDVGRAQASLQSSCNGESTQSSIAASSAPVSPDDEPDETRSID